MEAKGEGGLLSRDYDGVVASFGRAQRAYVICELGQAT